ncbi:hypothetical protein BH24ACT4_BH24ACT4_10160 [soil metagenome]
MSPFVFLVIPVIIIVLASLVMWVRGRTPTTLRSGIDGFSREMQALSPDETPRPSRRFESDAASRSPRPDQDV